MTGRAPVTRRWVVAYDIRDDARRERVARTLEDHGVRVQYSVFECELTAARRRALATRITEVMDRVRDTVSFYPLCPKCERRVRHIGSEPPEPDPEYVLL